MGFCDKFSRRCFDGVETRSEARRAEALVVRRLNIVAVSQHDVFAPNETELASETDSALDLSVR